MDDLVTWLRAQLDDDEIGRSDWEVVRIARPPTTPAAKAISEHIARWDPARVLAEVEAKRRILDEHRPVRDYDPNGPVCSTCGEPRGPSNEDAVVRWPCLTLRLLALPYADRPGYLQEWRP